MMKKYFDMWQTLGNILKYSKTDSKENICALKSGHTSQCDACVFMPFVTGVLRKTWPERNLPDVYMMYP